MAAEMHAMYARRLVAGSGFHDLPPATARAFCRFKWGGAHPGQARPAKWFSVRA